MLSPQTAFRLSGKDFRGKEIPGNFVSGVRGSEISGKGISQQKNY